MLLAFPSRQAAWGPVRPAGGSHHSLLFLPHKVWPAPSRRPLPAGWVCTTPSHLHRTPGTWGTGISGPIRLRASLSNLPLIICASLAFPPSESLACTGPPTCLSSSPPSRKHRPALGHHLLPAAVCQGPAPGEPPLHAPPEKGEADPGFPNFVLKSQQYLVKYTPSSPIRKLVIIYSLIHKQLFNACYVQAPHLRAGQSWQGLTAPTVNMHILSSAIG